MKKVLPVATAAAVAVLLVGVLSASGGTGNGAPNGPHFNLNIHGVANTGQGFNGNNKNDIWVPLQGKCNINLQMQPTFAVTQPDCVNNPPASFQLPNPCPDLTCSTLTYEVWARAVTPGAASMYSCYTDATGTYCDTDQYLVVSLNKVTFPKFVDVSKQLLTVCDATTGKTVPIFSTNDQYFWQYDNQGLRLAQLRFYEIPGDLSGVGTKCTATPQP